MKLYAWINGKVPFLKMELKNKVGDVQDFKEIERGSDHLIFCYSANHLETASSQKDGTRRDSLLLYI